MINLNRYVELLKEYSLEINEELQDILLNAKVNFDYQNITIKDVKISVDNDINIKLLIEQMNSEIKYIYEIVTSKNRGIDSICYQETTILQAMFFYKFNIDNKTLKRIIDLVLKYQDYFKSELGYENVMRTVRRLPNNLPFYDRLVTESEQEIFDTVFLEIEKLPSFIQDRIENQKNI